MPFLWASQVVLLVKNLPANAGDIRNAGLISGSRRFPGRGRGNPLQYSCLENSMNRGAWWTTVHMVIKSWTQLKQQHTHTHTHARVRVRHSYGEKNPLEICLQTPAWDQIFKQAFIRVATSVLLF